MANLSPPPMTGNAVLDRWLSILQQRVNAPIDPANIALGSLGNHADDVAAAAAGVAVGGMYRNGSVLMVRVS